MPSLIVVNGDLAGKQFELAKRPLSIGRDPSRDIQIVDPKVSRKHALLRLAADTYHISSVKSLNGVVINGERIAGEHALRDGDEIVLGDTLLRFHVATDQQHSNALHNRKIADRSLREKHTLM